MKTNRTTIKELEKSVKGKGREAHIAGHEASDILHDLNDLKSREAEDAKAEQEWGVGDLDTSKWKRIQSGAKEIPLNVHGVKTRRMTATEIIERQMGIWPEEDESPRHPFVKGFKEGR